MLPPLESSPGPELRHSPQPPARSGSAPEPIAPLRLQPPPMAKLESGGKAASRLAKRRDMADFDPTMTMTPTMAALRAEQSGDTSEYSIAGISDSLMVDVFNVYADSAATRTIGADRSAWKKWKVFLALNRIKKVWRDDVAANSGADAQGHRRAKSFSCGPSSWIPTGT